MLRIEIIISDDVDDVTVTPWVNVRFTVPSL